MVPDVCGEASLSCTLTCLLPKLLRPSTEPSLHPGAFATRRRAQPCSNAFRSQLKLVAGCLGSLACRKRMPPAYTYLESESLWLKKSRSGQTASEDGRWLSNAHIGQPDAILWMSHPCLCAQSVDREDCGCAKKSTNARLLWPVQRCETATARPKGEPFSGPGCSNTLSEGPQKGAIIWSPFC